MNFPVSFDELALDKRCEKPNEGARKNPKKSD